MLVDRTTVCGKANQRLAGCSSSGDIDGSAVIPALRLESQDANRITVRDFDRCTSTEPESTTSISSGSCV